MRAIMSAVALGLWLAAFSIAWHVHHWLTVALVCQVMGSNLSEWCREDKLKEQIRAFVTNYFPR